MDVDWAESQLPSAELRVGERVPGSPARLTLAHAPATELNGSRELLDVSEVQSGNEHAELCADEACVRARNEVNGPQVVKVELDVDAISVALAGALAAALDGRMWSKSTSAVHAPAASAAAPKRSFWAGAWHADVVLSSIAILVVVVVLLAWTV